jgi:hypothetical protein
MRYDEIAQAIIDTGYRVSVGATPAATVSAILSESIRKERKTPFVKVDRGVYALRSTVAATTPDAVAESDEAVEDAREMGLINAFGMYWNRASVRWKTNMPSLYGVQQFGSTPVNFTARASTFCTTAGPLCTSVRSRSQEWAFGSSSTPATAFRDGGTDSLGSACAQSATVAN